MKKVVTRFAPSPTGLPHVGTAIYALLNWLYARQKGGKVIMRSEDTDPLRSKREYEEAIMAELKWLGIEADEYYRQSDRSDIYKKYINQLIKNEKAYENEGAIKFKNPNILVTFNDLVRGDISVDTSDLHDFVIARDIDSPLYHLTVVADDFDMGVTHVIRGEDGLANTPRQILIQEAIGAPRPIYCHYPFILNTDRTKLSKRNGAVGINEYREAGYLPEALVNFLILQVWHPKDDQEIFTLEELIKKFELERIGKSGAIFDQAKLDWLNREHMKILSAGELEARAKEFLPEAGKKFLPLLLERINKFGDIPALLEGEFDFLLSRPKYTKELLVGKSGASLEEIKKHLSYIVEKGTDRDIVWPYAEEHGKGKVLWPMRVSLSGKEKSPDPLTLVQYLGKEESMVRLENAKKFLDN